MSAEPLIAVDANGADLGPAEVAAGAALAARGGARVLLFGPAEQMGAPADGVEVVDAPLSIAKAADPARAARSSPEASIVQAAAAVAQGRAQALVCAGGTGAALAAGLFNIRRARGIYRPALALPLPTPAGPVVLLDVGANTEARREHLVQFAFMGAAFAQGVLGIDVPRVALLSNGSEPNRGGEAVVAANAQLEREPSASFHFVGNVEGGGVLEGGVDVVVTDGFTGNVALKLIEGVSHATLTMIRDAVTRSWRAKAGGALLLPALRGMREQIDPETQGGAYLLGLRALMVVPHGRFGRRGFERAIVRAAEGTRRNVVAHTGEALAAAGALRQAPLAGGVPDASEEPSDAAPSPPPPSAPATSLRASQ